MYPRRQTVAVLVSVHHHGGGVVHDTMKAGNLNNGNDDDVGWVGSIDQRGVSATSGGWADPGRGGNRRGEGGGGGGGGVSVVWAWSGMPSPDDNDVFTKALSAVVTYATALSSSSSATSATSAAEMAPVRLYCGSTRCLEAGKRVRAGSGRPFNILFSYCNGIDERLVKFSKAQNKRLVCDVY